MLTPRLGIGCAGGNTPGLYILFVSPVIMAAGRYDYPPRTLLGTGSLMILPLFGFLLSAAFFAVVGFVVLRLSGIQPRNLSVLATFVVSAQVGTLAYASAYGVVFGGSDHQLDSTGAVDGLLIGIPIIGTIAGWLVARAYAHWLQPPKRA